ncbi:MAG: haloacid dehalogenase type II [Chloroflexi bacterium]|nr:haloacid dehalogenase type II [Chloroflexota bacterium]MCY3939217.1 haloacid dehalogenase type II [Chloroflexota bacterium]
MLDFDRFEWLSFDCYGTLVDWETGISRYVARVLESRGICKSEAEILALFADAEPRVQRSQDYMEYRRVLREVMAAIGTELGFRCTEPELECLADSLPDWPVFPDVVGALTALKTRYKLAVISNVDDDLFAGTAEAMGVDFDAVITAEQVRSYKPSPRNFDAAARRMAVEKQRWLHVAESLYHDIAPANRLGISCVWVNRANRGGGTRGADAVPDLVVPDLATLARMTSPA